jgi:hypothetical protein
MSKMYIILLSIAAVLIGVTSASFSVIGLGQLFAGASTAVIVMASSLEFAKFVCTGFVYRYWGHLNRPIRIYLLAAIFTLMTITSMGIYGFLANAYKVASLGWKTDMMKIAALKADDARLGAQVQEFRSFIDAIPANRISRKYEFQKIYDPQIKKIHTQQEVIQKQISELQMKVYTTQTKVGPITYVAEAFGTDVDTVVNYLMLLFVLVFDPLAVCLVFCVNLTIRLREKYLGDESKIGVRAMMGDIVDHRYKKAS